MRIVGIISAVLLLLVSANGIAQEFAAENYKGDERLQSEILAALETGYPKGLTSQEEIFAVYKKKLDKLLVTAGGDRTLLHQQLWYAGHHDPIQNNEQLLSMLWYGLIAQLLPTNAEAIEAALPFLGPNDNGLSKVGHSIIGFVKSNHEERFRKLREQTGEQYPDDGMEHWVEEILPYLRDHPDAREPLLDWAFQLHAPPALNMAMDSYGISDKERDYITERSSSALDHWKRRWSIRSRPEDFELLEPKPLEELSIHSRWWVRLYVAEVLRQVSSLESELLLYNLGNDTNPYVMASMHALQVSPTAYSGPRFSAIERAK